MGKGMNIKVTGLDRIQKKFGAIPKNLSDEIDREFDAAGDDFVSRAVQDAPQDELLLRQGISKKSLGIMHKEVVSSAPYSAFQEFGTKKKRQIPADLTAYASQFEGMRGGGSGKGFYASILGWVKRTGLASTYSVKTRKKTKSASNTRAEENAAHAIYRSIMINGVKAHPFFFKQREPVYKALQQRLQPALNKALNK